MQMKMDLASSRIGPGVVEFLQVIFFQATDHEFDVWLGWIQFQGFRKVWHSL
jgi:hypothetical protein